MFAMIDLAHANNLLLLYLLCYQLTVFVIDIPPGFDGLCTVLTLDVASIYQTRGKTHIILKESMHRLKDQHEILPKPYQSERWPGHLCRDKHCIQVKDYSLKWSHRVDGSVITVGAQSRLAVCSSTCSLPNLRQRCFTMFGWATRIRKEIWNQIIQ